MYLPSQSLLNPAKSSSVAEPSSVERHEAGDESSALIDSMCSGVILANLDERAGVEPPHLFCESALAQGDPKGALEADEVQVAGMDATGRARADRAVERRERCRGMARSADRVEETIVDAASTGV
jgi:hypothetical protein